MLSGLFFSIYAAESGSIPPPVGLFFFPNQPNPNLTLTLTLTNDRLPIEVALVKF